jgi:hypothetical protein
MLTFSKEKSKVQIQTHDISLHENLKEMAFQMQNSTKKILVLFIIVLFIVSAVTGIITRLL